MSAIFHTFRLVPGDDVFESIQRFVREYDIEAGCVVTCVGSLTTAVLRLANQSGYDTTTGHFEIVSLVGTVSTLGSHLHLSISDEQGITTGGHLVPGCIVYTTAEIVLAQFPELVYRRELDAKSGYEELTVYPRMNANER